MEERERRPHNARLFPFCGICFLHQESESFSGQCFLKWLFIYNWSRPVLPFSLCKCGLEAETIEHFIFQCKLYDYLRQPWIDDANKQSFTWPPPMAAIPHDGSLWKGFCKFIKKSGRLDQPSAAVSRSQAAEALSMPSPILQSHCRSPRPPSPPSSSVNSIFSPSTVVSLSTDRALSSASETHGFCW